MTQPQVLTLSSRKRRIVAYIIDHCVMTFLIVILVFLAIGPNFLSDSGSGKVIITLFVVVLPGLLIYFAKDSIKGISLGKWIMGIMVRDSKVPINVPSFGMLLLRNLLMIIWPVELIVLIVSDKKKRIGDNIANTIVVKNPNKPSKFPRILSLIGVGVTFIFFIILFAGNAMKSSDAYKVAIAKIERTDEILKETGGITGYGFMPSGSVSTENGNGEADLTIKVLGKEKDLSVDVYLTKKPNEDWQLIEMNN